MDPQILANVLALANSVTIKPNFTQLQLYLAEHNASSSDYKELRRVMEEKFLLFKVEELIESLRG